VSGADDAGFERLATLAEARRHRDRITSGALPLAEPYRSRILAWLVNEEIPRLERRAQAEGEDGDPCT